MGQCCSQDHSDHSDPVVAHRFYISVALGVVARHAIPHKVVSQILVPDLAAFLSTGRVVVRTHNDELCFADTASFIGDGPLRAADVAYLEQLPHLVRLNVVKRNIDVDFFALIARKLPRLQHLDLWCCDGVDAAGLAKVAKLPRLQHLSLRYCRDVDAAGLAEVAKLPQLQHLDLRYCGGVDAAGLAQVAKLPQLQRLDVGYCRGVDGAGLAEVAKIPCLQHLDLSGCRGVDACSSDLAVLREAGTVVRRTTLPSCHNDLL